MEFNTADIGWPKDTVMFRYPSLAALQQTIIDLWATEHVFVVSPTHNAIAMSRRAAMDIGVTSW